MQTPKVDLDWFYRYKLYHLPFWFIYHYLWWSISIGSPWAAASNIFFSPYNIKFFFYVIFQAVGVYFNLYYLLPKFLERGRYLLYVVLVLATILLTAALIVPGYYMAAWWNGLPLEEIFGMEPSEAYVVFFKTNSLPSTAASMTLAMSIKLTKNWLESKQQAQKLEKEKLETELKFLKSQFNPHFLFNTINSIFVLIHKSPDRASESLAKFSNLMRYQLYDCNAHLIPLQQELNYLENFIELEELRQEPNLELDVDIPVCQCGDLMIAPFILMPFVENAFKHVSQKQAGRNWIKIRSKVDKECLLFQVSNSTSYGYRQSEEVLSYGGLGLRNVQRRLDLLYPGRHRLQISREPDRFEVALELSALSISKS